jgi:hypothetical protein
MLHKPEFDCNKLGDFYDCGCGDEQKEGENETAEIGEKTAREDNGTSDTISPVEISREPSVYHPYLTL